MKINTLDTFKNKRLLIVANEAGGGSLLSEFITNWQPLESSLVIASNIAAPYFVSKKINLQRVDEILEQSSAINMIKKINPEWIVVGTSAFASVEKTFMSAAKDTKKPIAAFVDHYWNLWQRFAHEETAKKWYYRPDLIFVPSQLCAEKIVEEGVDYDRVRIFCHPLLKKSINQNIIKDRKKVLEKLNISDDRKIVLFVSEYGYPESIKWQWEQAAVGDLESLLAALLSICSMQTNNTKESYLVLIKLHPAQKNSLDKVLTSFSPSFYRIVSEFDKHELFSVTDIAFGLDSMLLLEASWAGIPSYSCHASGLKRGFWLSDLHCEVSELDNLSDCTRVINFTLDSKVFSFNNLSEIKK